MLTVASAALEEFSFHRYRRWRDLWVTPRGAVGENVGYRQLTASWRLQGLWAGLTGRTQVWGTMTRQGFAGHEVDVGGQPAGTGAPARQEDGARG